jgi:HSP20 family protein
MTKDVVQHERSTLDWPFPRRLLDWVRSPDWTALFDEADLLRVEEFEEGNSLVVRAELPGIDPDKDVDLHVEGGMLRLRAERRESTETKEMGRHRSEFRYGSFSRSLPLPSGASEDDVKATYKDGILEVRVPIDHASSETRKIPVTRV